nr:AAA family ATPase [Escherichia coli]
MGRNGTGKTTFMNILHSILSIDLDGINNNDFNSAEIKLKDKKKTKTIKIKKIESDTSPFSKIEYQLSSKNIPSDYSTPMTEESPSVIDAEHKKRLRS